MDLTGGVAEFVVGLRYEQIPDGARNTALLTILDTLGVALAGSREPVARIGAGLAREETAQQAAAVFGQRFRSSSMWTAFVNGLSVHAMDFDCGFATGQPTAGVLPTVLALAESLGASGRDAFTAYVVGFEVTSALVHTNVGQAERTPWHSPGTNGSLGCTAAAARLLGLSADEAAMALGIVSSMASGISANFGTMGKPLHAGLAARNGVLAARLAQKGFTANSSILDAERGFLTAFSGSTSPDLERLRELGSTYGLERGIRFKAYPCGGLAHSAVDAALALRRENGFEPDAVDRVDVQVTPFTAARIAYGVPKNELEAKFSMPYIVARTLLSGDLAPDRFADEAIQEPAVVALAEKVHMAVGPDLQDEPSGKRPARIRIQLRDGSARLGQADYPKGAPQLPMTEAELVEKFRSCARSVLTAEAVNEALDLIQHLDSLDRVSKLSDVLIGSADLASEIH